MGQTIQYIFITRMFSGLYESIKNSEWKPTGIPTIVNLAERLAIKGSLYWVLICKNEKESSIVRNGLRQIAFSNGITIRIITYKHFINSSKFNVFFNNIIAFFYLIKILKGLENKLFYCDRSNIIIAAIIKTFYRSPVVIRVLGLYPDQKALAVSFKSKLFNPLTFLSYKKHYDLSVCTQDGSGVEFYIDRLLNKKTKRFILFNGVDRVTDFSGKKILSEKIIFLFVGTIIKHKGILELIESFSRLKEYSRRFELKIIGKGELSAKVMDLIQERDLESYIEMVRYINLKDINQVYINSDVYISLNKLGNLSNTVLEAMSAGKCIVMLGKDEKTLSDVTTERLIPDDVVVRIDRNNIVNDLTEKLAYLINNPEKISIYSERMRSFAKEFLWSWDERINYEIELLEKVAKREFIGTND